MIAVAGSYARGNENGAHEADDVYYLGPGRTSAYAVFNLGGEFFALNNRCPHRGGSLCQGKQTGLVESDGPGNYRYSRPGEIIRCPWHGSEFSVTDGAVVQGPATRPQARYEVRVHHERVEVRRSDEVRALRTNPVGR